MLKNFIRAKLLDNLEFQPTRSQELLLDEMSDYIESGDIGEIMLIKGYAGTGKTTIVNSITRTVSELKQKSVLLAPTGRAAKVLSAYTGQPAWTVHKHIYRQKLGSDGLGVFVLDRNLDKDTYFIVDEASMIGEEKGGVFFGSGNLLRDLIRYVESGSRCRLILIGDTAQLPPVNLDISPALNREVLERSGYRVRECILTDIVRHQQGSGILYNATALRKQINAGSMSAPNFQLANFTDIKRISGEAILELISDSYNKYGEDETIVVTRSNKRANRFNNGIRNQILWKEEHITKGDLLMVVKNNYFWKDEEKKLDFVANGDIMRIDKLLGFEELYGLHFADVRLSMIDYSGIELEAKILLDVLEVEGPSLGNDRMKDLFQYIIAENPELTNQKQRSEFILKDPYFNALQVKFAYAVTCHKAQGGQWKSVFIDLGYFTEEMLTPDYLRWLYTAFTRSTEVLYLVNFPYSFFGE